MPPFKECWWMETIGCALENMRKKPSGDSRAEAGIPGMYLERFQG